VWLATLSRQLGTAQAGIKASGLAANLVPLLPRSPLERPALGPPMLTPHPTHNPSSSQAGRAMLPGRNQAGQGAAATAEQAASSLGCMRHPHHQGAVISNMGPVLVLRPAVVLRDEVHDAPVGAPGVLPSQPHSYLILPGAAAAAAAGGSRGQHLAHPTQQPMYVWGQLLTGAAMVCLGDGSWGDCGWGGAGQPAGQLLGRALRRVA
jgi:hypothetical protein